MIQRVTSFTLEQILDYMLLNRRSGLYCHTQVIIPCHYIFSDHHQSTRETGGQIVARFYMLTARWVFCLFSCYFWSFSIDIICVACDLRPYSYLETYSGHFEPFKSPWNIARNIGDTCKQFGEHLLYASRYWTCVFMKWIHAYVSNTLDSLTIRIILNKSALNALKWKENFAPPKKGHQLDHALTT